MLSLIFPTYNESESLSLLLPKVAEALKGLAYEVIIVDDDSPDKTWEVAQRMTEQYPQLRVIRRVGRRGLSSAVIEGFLSAKGDVLAVADADLQHDLSILPAMASAVETNHGIAVGSRYAEGGSVGQWDERRHTMSRIATRLALMLCRVKAKDPMSGFFAIDRELFQKIFRSLNPKGFKILLDVLICVPASTSVTEVPFTFGVRQKGESKLSRRVQVEFLEYLYEASVGRYIPLTFLQYVIVGALGVIVNLVAYFAVSRFFFGESGADFASASGFLGLPVPLVVGIEAAIIFNFLFNNSWTFSTVKLRGKDAVIGFLKYNVVCAFGALANYAITLHLYAQGFSEFPSIAFGALVGMMWNYTMSRMLTWKA